jgi:hypothetical protein
MKTKTLLLTAMATFGMTIATMAQNVPNYVPTNGLVGWWPFNGNVNDESGNGNNGTVSGATLAIDRFGDANSAYNFSATGQYIDFLNSSTWCSSSHSISFWFNGAFISGKEQFILAKRGTCLGGSEIYFEARIKPSGNFLDIGWGGGTAGYFFNKSFTPNSWNNVVYVNTGTTESLYINGVLVGQQAFNNPTNTVMLRAGNNSCSLPNNNYIGKFDDLGLWNRDLTQQEITDLFNAVNCANNTAITPQINSLPTGSTATFAASTSDPNPSYVWQSDFGQGYVTLNNFGNYSGVNSATLNIANVQLSEHNQPIRVITTSGNCIDTSNIAIINIADTCIATITDTTFITVTDTLIINTTITSLNPPTNSNTIKVFPNPTNDHITIDYGNFNVMNGYQLKIENSLGQQVFQTSITQQSDYLNLTTWGGNGLYFVHIIDPQGNTIDIRKIVLQ